MKGNLTTQEYSSVIIRLVWRGPKSTKEWIDRACKEAQELLDNSLATPADPIFHDVWDKHPDERPRIFMYGKKHSGYFLVKYLT